MSDKSTNFGGIKLNNANATDPDTNGEIVYVDGTGFRAYAGGSAFTVGSGGGASTFVGLTDTPSNFTAAGDKIVKVNTGATALEFVSVSGDVAMSAAGVTTVTDLTIAGEAQGALLYNDGSGWEALTAGTNGYILKAQGAAADPVWVDPATLPMGTATGLSQNFSIEGGTNDIAVATTTQTVGAGALTIPDFASVADTFAFVTLAQTLANKTLTSPDINGGTADSLTNFSIRSSGAAFDLEQDTAEVLTGNKIISWTVNDTNRAIDLGGDLTFANDFITSGNFSLTLTTTNTTDVTLPTTGTLASLAGAEVLENKSLEATCALVDTADNTKKILWDLTGATADKDITLTGVQTDDRVITFHDSDHTLVGADTTDTLTNKTLDCDGTVNTVSNVNADELDPITVGASTYSVPFVLTYNLTNQGAAVNIFNANAPFKFRVLDAYSVSTSADGGTWKLNNGAAGAGTDLHSAVTVAASDTDIDRIVDLDDAAWDIAASGSLSIVPDAGGALDCIIYITCLRVD